MAGTDLRSPRCTRFLLNRPFREVLLGAVGCVRGPFFVAPLVAESEALDSLVNPGPDKGFGALNFVSILEPEGSMVIGPQRSLRGVLVATALASLRVALVTTSVKI